MDRDFFREVPHGPKSQPRKDAVRAAAPVVVNCAGPHADEVGALAGIEIPEHTPEQTRRYEQMCADLGLIATGGSDYHGPQSGRANPPGTPRVPMAVYERLKEKAALAAAG